MWRTDEHNDAIEEIRKLREQYDEAVEEIKRLHTGLAKLYVRLTEVEASEVRLATACKHMLEASKRCSFTDPADEDIALNALNLRPKESE